MKVSIDEWIKAAKESENASKVGMWLTHAVDALNEIVGEIKSSCVVEKEIF